MILSGLGGAALTDTLEDIVQPSMASSQPTMATTNDLQERGKLNFILPKSHDGTPNTNNLQGKHQHQNTDTNTVPKQDIFPILSLPLELRLKIYSYILPPRHHNIVTSIPPTNFFYNTSTISNQTSYPFGHSAPLGPTGTPLSVPYKVLTKNTHTSYPHPSITTALLRTCKQIHAEAEPVLYGCEESVWDFGVHLEALRGFWGERSAVARESVRNVRLAFEVPLFGLFEAGSGGEMLGRKAAVWQRVVDYVTTRMKGLRELELMLWCVDGGTSGFPAEVSGDLDVDSLMVDEGMSEREEKEMMERRVRFELERRWREWKWTEDLLSMPSLRRTKITCWAAVPPTLEDGGVFGVTVPKFDSWVAGRMVADMSLRKKMIKDRVVVGEEVVILGSTGKWVRSGIAGPGERLIT
ncbi:hypothetical protein DL95DRAFT_389216 [Leptodontidium sp. 2 PMI_412]|nr:hypothetical protein DL95DRAFT_389216 [Leptodontidium sp. 2 PMI_412]